MVMAFKTFLFFNLKRFLSDAYVLIQLKINKNTQQSYNTHNFTNTLL